jgi:hypothetical protein
MPHSVLGIQYVDQLCSAPPRVNGHLRFDVTEARRYSWSKTPCLPERSGHVDHTHLRPELLAPFICFRFLGTQATVYLYLTLVRFCSVICSSAEGDSVPFFFDPNQRSMFRLLSLLAD